MGVASCLRAWPSETDIGHRRPAFLDRCSWRTVYEDSAAQRGSLGEEDRGRRAAVLWMHVAGTSPFPTLRKYLIRSNPFSGQSIFQPP